MSVHWPNPPQERHRSALQHVGDTPRLSQDLRQGLAWPNCRSGLQPLMEDISQQVQGHIKDCYCTHPVILKHLGSKWSKC